MSSLASPTYLVVANRTLDGAALHERLRRIVDAVPAARFHVIVPLRAPVLVSCDPVMAGYSVAEWDAVTSARADAEARLDDLLAWLAARGAPASGSVLGADPVLAVERALAQHPADAIVVSTLPNRLSRWLRLDLPRRLSRFGIPVVTVVNEEASAPPAVVG